MDGADPVIRCWLPYIHGFATSSTSGVGDVQHICRRGFFDFCPQESIDIIEGVSPEI